MSETSEAELIRRALHELLSAVSDLARIVDSTSPCDGDMPHVQAALEAAGRHVAALTSPSPAEEI